MKKSKSIAILALAGLALSGCATSAQAAPTSTKSAEKPYAWQAQVRMGDFGLFVSPDEVESAAVAVCAQLADGTAIEDVIALDWLDEKPNRALAEVAHSLRCP